MTSKKDTVIDTLKSWTTGELVELILEAGLIRQAYVSCWKHLGSVSAVNVIVDRNMVTLSDLLDKLPDRASFLSELMTNGLFAYTLQNTLREDFFPMFRGHALRSLLSTHDLFEALQKTPETLRLVQGLASPLVGPIVRAVISADISTERPSLDNVLVKWQSTKGPRTVDEILSLHPDLVWQCIQDNPNIMKEVLLNANVTDFLHEDLCSVFAEME